MGNLVYNTIYYYIVIVLSFIIVSMNNTGCKMTNKVRVYPPLSIKV